MAGFWGLLGLLWFQLCCGVSVQLAVSWRFKNRQRYGVADGKKAEGQEGG